METAGGEEANDREEEGDWDDGQDIMCPPGKHVWRHDLCMVCTVCRECTGYSISCLSSLRRDRNPGQYVLISSPGNFLIISLTGNVVAVKAIPDVLFVGVVAFAPASILITRNWQFLGRLEPAIYRACFGLI